MSRIITPEDRTNRSRQTAVLRGARVKVEAASDGTLSLTFPTASPTGQGEDQQILMDMDSMVSLMEDLHTVVATIQRINTEVEAKAAERKRKLESLSHRSNATGR